jgi:hypothetical protein
VSKKVVFLLGAGASVADVMARSQRARPPLDARFFSVASGVNSKDKRLATVRRYYDQTYGIDICTGEYDSMERIMAGLYPDLFNSSLEQQALDAFRALLQLFTERLADTTNNLHANHKRLLYRIIVFFLTHGIDPADITIVTFNQDVQVEKTLERLSETKRWEKVADRLFSFPGLYAIPEATWDAITSPSGGDDDDCFKHTVGNADCLQVLKLHGSLNWYSTHNSKTPTRSAMLNQKRKLSVTQRRTIAPDMKLTSKKTKYTLPVVVPPVTHKSSVLPAVLGPVWELAEKRLIEADEVVVFGYSCPALDFESANLLRRAGEKAHSPTFTVIDPAAEVATRYISLLGLKQLNYYRDGYEYIRGIDE